MSQLRRNDVRLQGVTVDMLKQKKGIGLLQAGFEPASANTGDFKPPSLDHLGHCSTSSLHKFTYIYRTDPIDE